jgi:fermentation-respiration switch protein FrsA (DUF1100 family)
VHAIAPTPLLLVHGGRDHYFPPDHATALHAATGGHSQLWLLPELRHAESAMTPDLVDRIAGWLGRPVEAAVQDSRPHLSEKDELSA